MSGQAQQGPDVVAGADADVRRALDYPYKAPAGSYLFANGEALAYSQPGSPKRWPVIGYGSNRAPEQLQRKYQNGAAIPVEAAVLHGFDVVYAARLSGYGAIPATLAECAGVWAAVKVLWLSQAEFPAMHASEGVGVAYDFGVLEAPLVGEHSGPLPRALVYIARSGAWAPDGVPVPLAEIEAPGRRWPALDQTAAQQRLLEGVGGTTALSAFVREHVADKAVRQARAAAMAKQALPWRDTRFRALDAASGALTAL